MFGKSTTRNLVLSLGLGAMISAAAFAQTTASAAPTGAASSAPATPSLTKIGVVNFDTLWTGYLKANGSPKVQKDSGAHTDERHNDIQARAKSWRVPIA